MPKLLRSPDGNLVEFACELEAETTFAILVTDGTKEYWIPRSQIHETELPGPRPADLVIYLPEWLAYEKGII